ncbi:MAG: aminodeoxychorismate synthase component I [Kyrpidia sp.]|nr:aminodeoxychorismate synthase component I [Kyrpidia sp.]
MEMNPNVSSPYVLLDFVDDRGRCRRLFFSDPAEVIVAARPEEVLPALGKVQRAVREGHWVAGLVSYEAASGLDPALKVRGGHQLPLVWFGVFDRPPSTPDRSGVVGEPFQLSNWRLSLAREVYDERIRRIRRAIAEGDTYQINFTMRLRAFFEGDERTLYETLLKNHPVPYAACLCLGRFRVLSMSPELFFRVVDRRIVTRPMKGTAKRGRWPEEDERQHDWLAGSEKNRAENVMIVDLLRNDLARIARTGSVRVSRLFEIERYRTVFQMTSTITADLRDGVGLPEIFASLFPSGSVTGTPKVSAMRIIADLEEEPREAYCGTVGFVNPQGEAVFNVAIRTLIIDGHNRTAVYGAGGGVTWDSGSREEYEEALAKAAFLVEPPADFALLETMRLENGRYLLLERHLDRLFRSAGYFDMLVDRSEIVRALEHHARLHPGETRRVRLLLGQDGAIHVESTPLSALSAGPATFAVRPAGPGKVRGGGVGREGNGSIAAPLPVAVAKKPVSSGNCFLFHKTTRRSFYEEHREPFPDVFDVLLWNEKREITEFTNGNVVLEVDGRKCTPPVSSGLLPGTFRAELLDQGEIVEECLSLDDLVRAQRIWFINSVRGWVPVHLIGY